MKMDNNMNNNVDNNVIDFSEYINPENELSEEMLQAYLDAADMETPDLWNRIDEGYDFELDQIKQEHKRERKKRNEKLFAILVVAGMILIIVTPVIYFGMNRVRDLTEDKTKDDKPGFVVNESFDEDIHMESTVNESEMAMDEAPAEDIQEESANEAVSNEQPTESAPSDATIEDSEPTYDLDELVDSAASIVTNHFVYEDGHYVIYVKRLVDIGENDYGLKPGNYVVAVNTEEVDALLQEFGIYAEGESYYDYGELAVFMYIIDYYEEEEGISHKVIVTNIYDVY